MCAFQRSAAVVCKNVVACVLIRTRCEPNSDASEARAAGHVQTPHRQQRAAANTESYLKPYAGCRRFSSDLQHRNCHISVSHPPAAPDVVAARVMGCSGGGQEDWGGCGGSTLASAPSRPTGSGLAPPVPAMDQTSAAAGDPVHAVPRSLRDATGGHRQRTSGDPSASERPESSSKQDAMCKGESDRAGAPVTPGQSSDAPSIQGASSTDQDAPAPPAVPAAPAARPAPPAQEFLPLAFRKKRSCEEFTPPVDAPVAPTAPLVCENPGAPRSSTTPPNITLSSHACGAVSLI